MLLMFPQREQVSYNEIAARPRTSQGAVIGAARAVGAIGAVAGLAAVAAADITPIFKTPAPEGPYRDEIIVEIVSMNGQHYLGTVTTTEAKKTIYEEALGLDLANLASINIGFNRGCIVTFKLKQQMDLDDLYERQNFEFERSLGNDICVVACHISGVCNPAN